MYIKCTSSVCNCQALIRIMMLKVPTLSNSKSINRLIKLNQIKYEGNYELLPEHIYFQMLLSRDEICLNFKLMIIQCVPYGRCSVYSAGIVYQQASPLGEHVRRILATHTVCVCVGARRACQHHRQLGPMHAQ